MNAKVEKQRIREKIWKLLEEKRVAKFPLSCYGRIPNFEGSEKAAENLLKLKEWKEAKVIFINPDSPQRKVRELALKEGKTVIIASPKLKKGFIMISPKEVKGREREASTIKGAFKYGKFLKENELPEVDLIVQGSVAVDKKGNRLGKGLGLGDREIEIIEKISRKKIPIITTVHEFQIVEKIPSEKHDKRVDVIITPSLIIRCNHR